MHSLRLAVATGVAVGLAGIALAGGATPASAVLTPPFDLFVLKVHSPFFAQKDPYTRVAQGGRIRIRTVWVRNLAEGPAPRTRVGFAWQRETRPPGGGNLRGPTIATVRMPGMDGGEQRKSDRLTVPLPVRNGRYHLWACANTPKAERAEPRRDNNCSELRRLVIVDRVNPVPDPNSAVLLSVSPDSLNFGQVAAGSRTTANVSVSNRGTGSTGPGATFVNGSGASAFSVSSNGCASGLSGVGSCRVTVAFSPLAPGNYEATLAVQFGEGPTVTVPLHGSS